MSYDAELEAFKTQIDLRQYAAAFGYAVDRKESYRTATVMRLGDDKIIIRRDEDGHFLYYSYHGGGHGSIIDFVQRHQGLSLGVLRKELRSWLGMPRPLVEVFPNLETAGKDPLQVQREFEKMHSICKHPYLENDRRIPEKILDHDRFAGSVYADHRGNVIFPHYNFFPYLDSGGSVEPCGYEIKNRGFTGFAPGGTKGLWTSEYCPGLCYSDSIVICESAIDALSHAVLFPDTSLYVSVAGQASSAQLDLITFLVAHVEPKEVGNMKVIAAMDADEAGAELIDAVLIAAERSGRKGLECFQHVPVGYKDWNEQLQAQKDERV